MHLGVWEIILIVLVILLIFGGKKIPELMRGLGKGVKSFKEGLKETDNELKDEVVPDETGKTLDEKRKEEVKEQK